MPRQSGQIFGDRDESNDVIANVTNSALHVNVAGPLDTVSGHLEVIDPRRALIHQGRMFSFSSVDQAVAASGVVEILMRVPSGTTAHMAASGAVSVDMIGTLWDGPTTSADGTPITARNRHRGSATTPLSSLFASPTVTGDGTRLMEIFIPGGSGKQAAGGSGDTGSEWALDAGDYLLRIENISGTANSIANIEINWAEYPS